MGLEFLKSINSVTSSQAADKMEEKATLIFGEQTIKSLKELREHFDKEACLAALKDGTLYRWLVQHYYEKEAQGIKRLRIEDAAFEEELTDSADYYAMYNFDYFMDQVDVEEHDFCVSDDNTITKFFEALLTDNIQYTIPDILSTVREMEDDLNEHADTFFKAAHTEYENYVKKIEELIDMLGKNMPAMNENESLKEYLSRLCVKQAV